MDYLLWGGLVLYLYIGAGQATRNISRGYVGSAGPMVTFIFTTLFWPLLPRH